MKKEIITSALTELDEAKERCNIPSMNGSLSATKETPLNWNAYESIQNPSPVQNDNSFKEQKFAIKVCIDAIDNYNDMFQNHMVKSCTIRGFAGCGKSWCMQYLSLIHISEPTRPY